MNDDTARTGDRRNGHDTDRSGPGPSGGLETTRRRYLTAAGALAVAGIGASATTALGQTAEPTSFTVRLENASSADTLQTTADDDAAAQPVPLSPGAWAVHTSDQPIFASGHPERNNGLEEIAEDGMPGRLVESLNTRDTVVSAGAFTTPDGAEDPAPILPGDAYEFSIEASPGRPATYLSLVTMFVPSNDLFFALGGETGMPLFGGGDSMANDSAGGQASVAGDVTDHVGLWDAGTEINEEPGVGANQAQRQRGAGVGLVERGTVAPIEEVNGYDYPATSDVLRLRITPS